MVLFKIDIQDQILQIRLLFLGEILKFVLSLFILFSAPAFAAKGIYMSIMGMQNGNAPIPYLTISCPDCSDLKGKTVEVNVYSYEKSKGLIHVAVLQAEVLVDTVFLSLFRTRGKGPKLRIEILRDQLYSTAPFSYAAKVLLQGLPLEISPFEIMRTQELNPSYPHRNKPHGPDLMSELVSCSRTLSRLHR